MKKQITTLFLFAAAMTVTALFTACGEEVIIDDDNKKISLSIKALLEGERPAAPAFEDSGADTIVYDTDAPQDYSGEEE